MRLSRGQRVRVSVALIMALGALASGVAGQLQPWWYLGTAVSAIGAAAVGVGTYRQMRPEPRTAPVTQEKKDWPPANDKVWNIPQPVIDFVGRAEDIKVMKKRGFLRGPVSMALHGIGGVGKSQLALKYGASEQDNLQVGWIINAAKRDYILEGLSQLGIALHLPRPADPAEGARETLEELGRRRRWLIVYDDAQNHDELQDLLPNAGDGITVITSRSSNWGSVIYRHEVKPLDLAAGSQMLAIGTGYNDQSNAEEITRRLGGLPLALSQAAAYCRSTGLDFEEYLDRYSNAPVRLLERDAPHEYGKPVARTWVVSLREARRQNPAAIELLRVLAYVAPVPLPRDVLFVSPETFRRRLRRITADPLAIDDAIAVLHNLSLVTVNEAGVSLHALLQLIVTEQIKTQGRCSSRRLRRLLRLFMNAPERHYIKAVVSMLETAFPKPRQEGAQTDRWERCASLRPHVELALSHAEHVGSDSLAAARLRYWFGYYLSDRGEYEMAIYNHKKTIAARTRLLGEEHPETLDAMNNLASSLGRSGELALARDIGEKVLNTRTRVLGDDHPDTLISTNNLGRVLYLLGDIRRARSLLEKSLSGFERVRGIEHQNTLGSMANLALVLMAHGEDQDARALHERALAGRARVLGPKDPDTLRSVYHVACIRYADGELTMAKAMLEECLSSQQELLSDRHPDTKRTLQKLSEVELAIRTKKQH